MADATPQPDQEVEALVNTLVPFARRMLERHGSFVPFGATVDAAGDVNMVAAHGEHGTSAAEAAGLLEDGLRQAAADGQIRACGICTDVRVDGDDGVLEAISVALEHAARDPLRVFVSYETTASGEHGFGKPIAAPGERRVFA